MKILLLNPLYTFDIGKNYEKYFVRSGSRWPHSGVKKKGDLPHYLPFPFFLAYAAAWLKREGFDVSVADCVALDIKAENFLEKVVDISPDIIFYEMITPTADLDIDFAKKLKRIFPKTKIILGGTHATTFSKDILSNNPEIDFIVKGEYEEILVNLSNAIRNGEDVENLKGVDFYSRKKELVPSNLIYPLDKLPFPAYEMFPAWGISKVIDKSEPTIYWDGFCQKRPAIQMHASRGCPYRCNFCLWNQVMYRNGKYRTFSVDRIISDIKKVIEEYSPNEIYFDDDDFTIDKNYVKNICERLISEKININWSCMGDAINPDEELINLMAQSGCIGMKFGVETASPKTLKNLGKPINLNKVKSITKWCAQTRIKTHATFTLGLIGEDMDSLKETLSFMKSLNTDSIQVSISTPFPGTAFYEYALLKNMIKAVRWEDFDGKAVEVVRHENLDLEEVERLRKIFIKKWIFARLLSPSWIVRQTRNFFRCLKGLGPAFIFSQILGILRDEFNLRKECK